MISGKKWDFCLANIGREQAVTPSLMEFFSPPASQ